MAKGTAAERAAAKEAARQERLRQREEEARLRRETAERRAAERERAVLTNLQRTPDHVFCMAVDSALSDDAGFNNAPVPEGLHKVYVNTGGRATARQPARADATLGRASPAFGPVIVTEAQAGVKQPGVVVVPGADGGSVEVLSIPSGMTVEGYVVAQLQTRTRPVLVLDRVSEDYYAPAAWGYLRWAGQGRDEVLTNSLPHFDVFHEALVAWDIAANTAAAGRPLIIPGAVDRPAARRQREACRVPSLKRLYPFDALWRIVWFCRVNPVRHLVGVTDAAVRAMGGPGFGPDGPQPLAPRGYAPAVPAGPEIPTAVDDHAEMR